MGREEGHDFGAVGKLRNPFWRDEGCCFNCAETGCCEAVDDLLFQSCGNKEGFVLEAVSGGDFDYSDGGHAGETQELGRKERVTKERRGNR